MIIYIYMPTENRFFYKFKLETKKAVTVQAKTQYLWLQLILINFEILYRSLFVQFEVTKQSVAN